MEIILKQALQHVRDGERHIRRQEEIVEFLRAGGHDTANAREILQLFEWSLALHRRNLRRMLAQRHDVKGG